MPTDTMINPVSHAPLRRRPVQRRSAQRVERMLEACAALIEEVGYDGLTTTLIAERAGVAVGSLYQFFPDKRAVVHELALRNVERFMHTLSERYEQAELRSWWDAIDIIFDVYMTMQRQTPGFARLNLGLGTDMRVFAEGQSHNVTDKLKSVLAERFGLSTEEWDVPLTVVVSAADSVLQLAFQRAESQAAPAQSVPSQAKPVQQVPSQGMPSEGMAAAQSSDIPEQNACIDERLIRECQEMLRGYLSTRLQQLGAIDLPQRTEFAAESAVADADMSQQDLPQSELAVPAPRTSPVSSC